MLKKLLLNPWSIGIGSAVIATGVIAVIQKINFIESISIIYEAVISLLNFKISIKFIVMTFLVVFVVFKIIKFRRFGKTKEPLFLGYTKDKYKEWTFKWEYEVHYGKYSVEYIQPICKCGCSLTRKNHHNNVSYGRDILVCPKCDTTYKNIDSEIIDDFRAIIYHNIEMNNFRNNDVV